MIIASIEFATVTQHDVRGWKGAYVPININLFIIHPDHHKVVGFKAVVICNNPLSKFVVSKDVICNFVLICNKL